MANAYYFHNTPPYYHQNPYSQAHHPSSHAAQPFPLHLCFFLLTLFLFIAFSWYMSYESALESLIEQVKFLFMVSPLVLLLVVHLMSSRERRHVPFFAPLPEHQQPFYCSRGRAGGIPVGGRARAGATYVHDLLPVLLPREVVPPAEQVIRGQFN
ncbi:hypothetical protein ACMD2_11069 [Ananas comosus]|uniref:Uncharacterized protein n=1 Tax=Ananas comosus TaxID=4615 RepID=A0A199V9L9_ANACO|nr:hypothetical protein ACMD2_11069 [Ananas comosus]